MALSVLLVTHMVVITGIVRTVTFMETGQSTDLIMANNYFNVLNEGVYYG